VVDERSGEIVYTLRARTPRFKPWVFAEGSYTVKIGEPPARMKVLKAQRSAKP
jgi:flagellar basal body P-ring protein FlgI